MLTVLWRVWLLRHIVRDWEKNGNFLLMHCVGSIPHNGEIDVPLNYADYYYFLEALKRKGI